MQEGPCHIKQAQQYYPNSYVFAFNSHIICFALGRCHCNQAKNIYMSICTHICTYINTYIHTYMHNYMCVSLYAIVVCVYVCVHVCVCEWVSEWVVLLCDLGCIRCVYVWTWKLHTQWISSCMLRLLLEHKHTPHSKTSSTSCNRVVKENHMDFKAFAPQELKVHIG